MASSLFLLGICWLSIASAAATSSRDPVPTTGLEAQIRDLAERVLQLEERDLQQRQEIDDLRSKVDVGEHRVVEIERQHQSDIGRLKKELRLNQRRTTWLENILGEFRNKAPSAEQREVREHGEVHHKSSSAEQRDTREPTATTTDTNDRNTQTSQRERRLTPHVGTRPDPTVAFFASLSPHVTNAGAKQILVFDRVITNIGSAYSNTIGTFTAPVPGVYVFSVTIMSYNFQTEHYSLSKNGSPVVNMFVYATKTPDTNTGHTAVLHLAQGNTVEIHSNDADGSAHGSHYSSFSGFLLHQDDTLAIIG